MPPRMRFVILLTGALALSATAMGDTAVTVLLDTDRNESTGCSVATADGIFHGADRQLVAVVDTHLPVPAVVSLRVQDCINPTTSVFGPPSDVQSPFSPPWPLGIHSAAGTPDIVEMYLPGITGFNGGIRVGVTTTALDGPPSSDALLTSGSGHAAIVVPAAVDVPAASDVFLALLAATLAGWGAIMLRRRPGLQAVKSVLLLAAIGLPAVALYAQIAFIPDGQAGDWAGQVALAVDDPPAGDVGSDIVGIFGRRTSAAMLQLRVDLRVVPDTQASNDSVVAAEDGVLTVPTPGVLANDLGLALAAQPIAGGPTSHGGSVSLSSGGGFTYTPPPDYFGPDAFSYTTHGLAGNANAVVTINVTPVNDAPRFTAGPGFVLNVDPGSQSSTAWATGIAAGPPNEASQVLTANVTIVSTTGTLAFDQLPSLSVPSGNLAFTPRNGTYGTATVQITLHDDGGTAGGGSDSVAHTFTITVDTPPVANDDQGSANEGVTCLELNLLTNDSDVDGDPLSVIITSEPVNGELFEFDSGGISTGHLCYRPFKRFFHGTDQFTYRADDHRGGLSAPATVNIEIRNIN
jgi:hypothetical protein